MNEEFLDLNEISRDRLPLDFRSGWMNAAGILGFAPPAEWPLSQPPAAFVTNPVSYRARQPAQDRALVNYPGGFLLHTGWPSPGFREVVRRYASRWERSPVPVWVHLLGDAPGHIERMVRQLEELDGVAAVELSFSRQASGVEILDGVRGALGELPLILAVPLERIREDWLSQAASLGLAAISMAPPRGVLATAAGAYVRGRLYGPGLLPQARAALELLRGYNIPVIAGCGVMKLSEIDELINAGAACVQLDFILWRGWPPVRPD